MASKFTDARARLLSAIGYSELRPIDESAWRRGWNDTKAGLTDWRFALADYVGPPVIGIAFEPVWGIVAALTGLLVLWTAATASAPVRQRNEARSERAGLASGIQASDRVLAVQKLEDMMESGFWERRQGGAGLVRDFERAAAIKGQGTLEYHVELGITAIPSALVEDVYLQIAGQQIHAAGWETVHIEHEDRLVARFPLPPLLASGDHDLEFVASLDGELRVSPKYQVRFP